MSFDFYIHLLISFFLGLFSTYLASIFLNKLGFVDSPNSRSLHFDPTPTSGGIAIGLSLWISAWYSVGLDEELFAWLLASTAFSVLGLVDDYKSRTVFFRLAYQFLIAFCLISWIFLELPTYGDSRTFFYTGFFLITAGLIATINLFNFMDGTDGLAGAQSLIYFLCFAYMFELLGIRSFSLMALCLSGVTGGFLIFNWPPARIFMGDSGSYFLGSFHFAFGYLYFLSGNGLSFPIILAAPFLCDSVLTLLYRFLTSQNWWQAHRSHCYQVLIMNGMKPRTLVFAFLLLHIVFIIPLGFLSFYCAEYSSYLVLITYLVTSFIWYYLKRKYAEVDS